LNIQLRKIGHTLALGDTDPREERPKKREK